MKPNTDLASSDIVKKKLCKISKEQQSKVLSLQFDNVEKKSQHSSSPKSKNFLKWLTGSGLIAKLNSLLKVKRSHQFTRHLKRAEVENENTSVNFPIQEINKPDEPPLANKLQNEKNFEEIRPSQSGKEAKIEIVSKKDTTKKLSSIERFNSVVSLMNSFSSNRNTSEDEKNNRGNHSRHQRTSSRFSFKDARSENESALFNTDDLKRSRTNFGSINRVHSRRWTELQIVVEAGLATSLSAREIKMQEKWYELYATELNYFITLDILLNFIMVKLEKSLVPYEFNYIFSKQLVTIFNESRRFLVLMEEKIQKNVLITNFFGVFDAILSSIDFQIAYIGYAGQVYLQREHLNKLLVTNKKFDQAVEKLHRNKFLEGKKIVQYMIAPVQRLAQYKLLIDAIVKDLRDEENELRKQGLGLSKTMQQLLKRANEQAAFYMDYAEIIQLYLRISHENQEFKISDLMCPNRRIIYHGDLELISIRPSRNYSLEKSSVSFKSSTSSLSQESTASATTIRTSDSNSATTSLFYHLVLFSDILIVALKQEQKTVDISFSYKLIENVSRECVHAYLGEGSCDDGDSEETMQRLLKIQIDELNFDCVTVSSRIFCFRCKKYEAEQWLAHFNLKI